MRTFILYLFLSVGAFGDTNPCPVLIANQNGENRVVVSVVVGGQLRSALARAGVSAKALAADLEISESYLRRFFRQGASLPAHKFSVVLSRLPEEERAAFQPVYRPRSNVRRAVSRGEAKEISPAQARLLRSYRRNSLLTYPQLAQRFEVSGSFLFKVLGGETRTLRTTLFEKLSEEFELSIEAWELAGDSSLPCGENSGVCEHYSPRVSFTQIPFVHYSDPVALETDLFRLVCRGDVHELMPRLRGWFLHRA